MALAMAWAFDVSLNGWQRSKQGPVDAACPPAFVPGRRNVITLVTVGAAISALCGYFLLSCSPTATIDKSIAVLPFENFSEDKDNEHFAGSVHDDVAHVAGENRRPESDLANVSHTISGKDTQYTCYRAGAWRLGHRGGQFAALGQSHSIGRAVNRRGA
jgi:hypothetical protein